MFSSSGRLENSTACCRKATAGTLVRRGAAIPAARVHRHDRQYPHHSTSRLPRPARGTRFAEFTGSLKVRGRMVPEMVPEND